jgi:hypothetical protein
VSDKNVGYKMVDTVCAKCGSARIVRPGQEHKLCPSCSHMGQQPNKTHGDAGVNRHARLYDIWVGMNFRCNPDSKHRHCKAHGARGIRVCQEWKDSYPAFKEWALANGYGEKLQIDRINNDGNYEPGNCRWVTAAINARNKRNTVMNEQTAEYIRELKRQGWCMRDVAWAFGINESVVYQVAKGTRWAPQ